MSPLPGPVRQIGYVVKDFDKALASWLAAGVGPWFVLRGLQLQASYRGQPCAVTLSIGLANTGDMQVEVIQQEDATPSIYTEFLDSGRDGYHQLAWWATDFESAVRGGPAARANVAAPGGAGLRACGFWRLSSRQFGMVRSRGHRSVRPAFVKLRRGARLQFFA